MNFLLDNWLAVRHARALDALFQPEHGFAHAREVFGPNVKDAEFIAALGQEPNRIVISGDYRAATLLHLRRSWQQAGSTTFFLNQDWARLPTLRQNARLAAMAMKLIQRANVRPGAGFLVSVAGKIEQLYQPSSGPLPG